MREDTDTRAIDNFIVRLRSYIEDEPGSRGTCRPSAASAIGLWPNPGIDDLQFHVPLSLPAFELLHERHERVDPRFGERVVEGRADATHRTYPFKPLRRAAVASWTKVSSSSAFGNRNVTFMRERSSRAAVPV